MEIFLLPGGKRDYMACGLPRKSEKDRKGLELRGAKEDAQEGGSIRAGPRAQEEG